MNAIEESFRDYTDFISAIPFVEAKLDYAVLDKHLPVLKAMDTIETGAISVFDLFLRKHLYMSGKYKEIYNIDQQEHLEGDIAASMANFHPEDLVHQNRAGLYFLKFLYTIPVEKRKDYKFISEYRLKINGYFTRVIEQFIGLELDTFGNPWLGLSILDRSPDNDLEAPCRTRLLNFKTGDLYHFPPKPEVNLSNREREVLRLVANGLISKQIADKLFLSVNTVNTHRQRIIEKLNVANSAEAIKYVREHGLI